jgi:hypothetical protein
MKQKILDVLPPKIYLRLKYWDYRVTHKDRFAELQDMRKVTTDQGYSYKPFDEKKSIFIHIPKCAGVAVNRTIFGNLAGGHTTLEEYLNIFEPKCIASYFKFTIVRNPWDRLVSAFFFLKSGGMNGEDRTGFRRQLGDISDFRGFVRSWVNRKNIWKWHQFRPQYHYMLDKRDKVHLDFIAFLENIDDDFAHIVGAIGLDKILPKSNKSEHSQYTSYYDKETADIVSRVYAEDIKVLGYNFDNSSLASQLDSRNSGKIYSLHQ